jgi:ribonuclease-3
MTREPPNYESLEQRLGYQFRSRELLARALTHMSDAAARGKGRGASYQRLEFLGDRVLGLGIAALLVRRFPQADEGELSQRLAALVRKETCAEVAAEWNVGAYMHLAASEARAGGRDRVSILGDVCEALIGAVFLDAENGFAAASAVIERGFGPLVDRPPLGLRDAKTALQEWAQADGKSAPAYTTLARTGPDHAPQFRIAVSVDGLAPAEAVGRSKREAEHAAARAFLEREGLWERGGHA